VNLDIERGGWRWSLAAPPACTFLLLWPPKHDPEIPQAGPSWFTFLPSLRVLRIPAGLWHGSSAGGAGDQRTDSFYPASTAVAAHGWLGWPDPSGCRAVALHSTV